MVEENILHLFNKKALKIEQSPLAIWSGEVNSVPGSLKFNVGQPDFLYPWFVSKNMNSIASEVGSNFYKPTVGSEEAIRAISTFFSSAYGVKIGKKQVMVTNGAKEGIYLALETILNPDEEVIYFNPSWPTYRQIIEKMGAIPIEIDLLVMENGYCLDFVSLEKNIKPGITKAIIINSPNNPTGYVFSKEEMERIAEIAIKYDILVVSDEIYDQITFNKECISMLQTKAAYRSIVINGFSKSIAMPGNRIAWIIASEDAIKLFAGDKNLINGNTNSLMLGVIRLVFTEHIKNLANFISDKLEIYQRRMDFICESFEQMGVKFIKPEGTFYLFAQIPEEYVSSYSGENLSEDFARFMLYEYNIAIAPGIYFGKNWDNYFRFSFASSEEDIKEGMRKLKTMIIEMRGDINDI